MKNKNYTKNGNKSHQKHPEKASLGRTLFRSRFNNPGSNEIASKEKWLHTSAIDNTVVESFKSVTEQSSLDEFLNTAELAGHDFESEKLNLNFASPKTNAGIFNVSEVKQIKESQAKFKDICLRIPRKPMWKGHELDAATLQRQEREAFLEWRRQLALAQLNEHLSMTPFEKNLDFWRQLWRVIERSDVIVQIVDARNPTLFHCEDLEVYVKEIDENKLNILLINKSDFLSEKQRLQWLKFYEEKKIHVVFWSAALATEIDPAAMSESSDLHTEDEFEHKEGETNESESEEEEEKDEDLANVSNRFKFLSANSDSEEVSDSDESIKEANTSINLDKKDVKDEDKEGSETEVENNNEELTPEKVVSKKSDEISNNEVPNLNKHQETEIQVEDQKYEITDEERKKCKILNRDQLIQLFKTVHKSPDKAKAGITTIGLVGYPNVGKSSTINAILEGKKVAVSETPGKTKHYQTLYFDDELLLCDCPGLVFPSFVSTRGELILNGILPIDQMRDYNEPINLATQHIPRNVIEMYYGIQIPKPKEYEDQNRLPTSEEVCSAYSIYRGYFNHKGMPDVSRGARYILKDYVNGKLLYCYPPPGIDGKSFQDHKYEQSKEVKYFEKTRKIQQQMKKNAGKPTNFDKDFFENLQVRALTKGGIVGSHRTNKALKKKGADLNSSLDSQLESKSWKKHFKKKEGGGKLRRVTGHFDKTDLF